MTLRPARVHLVFIVFFFNDTATTEIYTLSLHDALPISSRRLDVCTDASQERARRADESRDRKSTRLNSSHLGSSYAVFCLKKKKNDGQEVVEIVRDASRELSDRLNFLRLSELILDDLLLGDVLYFFF